MANLVEGISPANPPPPFRKVPTTTRILSQHSGHELPHSRQTEAVERNLLYEKTSAVIAIQDPGL